MRGLKESNAIVTGGASGIGKAITHRLVEEGVRVHIFDIDGAGARATLSALGREAGSVREVDISDYEAVCDAVKALAEEGPIKLLVNNAGWDKAMPFVDTTPDLWKRVVDINYMGPLHVLHAVLPHMLKEEAGKVVNIASDAGRVGSTGEAVYAGCKAGIIALGKSVAREVAKKGICINAICPGPTDTALLTTISDDEAFAQRLREGLERAIPMKRLGQPDDIAGLVTFLLSDEAGFITGQVVSVSGGLTMHG